MKLKTPQHSSAPLGASVHADFKEGDYLALSERAWVKRVARTLALLMLCQASLSALPAMAQVIPGAHAPAGQRAIMDAARNGVPIAHIAPPSAGGVSRNQYDQFNVNNQGLILNNSATAVQTQQGGWISGNMQLGPVPARIILNEVGDTRPSQLRGSIEVAGAKADIVIANPNGITCEGCGFLNTSRATLTTGQPQFNSNGSLHGFDVRNGDITVGSGGLNATHLEQLDLLARGIVIEGEVWAKNLNAIAGANKVLYGTLQATASTGTGPAPAFAIDIKNLGGMYANQIYMVSSERGVGVNSTGRTAALQGNLALSVNGDLTLKDSYAKQGIQIDARNVTLTGLTQSEGATTIQAAGAVTQTGTLETRQGANIHAESLDNSGTIAQRGSQTLSIATRGELANTGTVLGLGDTHLAAGSVRNQGGQLLSSQNLTLASGTVDNTNGNIVANRQLTLSSEGAIDNSSGQIASNEHLAISASTLTNQSGTVSASHAANVQLGTGLFNNNQGTLVGSRQLSLGSGEIRNDGGLIGTNGGLTLNTQGHALSNTNGGLILANGDLAITSASLDNTNGTAASTAGQLNILTQGQPLKNDGGRLQAFGDLRISAASTSNQRGIIAGNNIIATTGAFDNSRGQIVSAGAMRLSTAALTNASGAILATGNLHIHTNGQALTNTASGSTGGIAAGGTLAINAGSLNNQSGLVASNGDQKITTTGEVDNQGGQLITNGNAALTTAFLNNQGGVVGAVGQATIFAGTVDNKGGAIAANGDLQISATHLDNREHNGVGGTIDGANISINATGFDNRGGTVRAAQDAKLSAGSIHNSSGTLSAAKRLSINSSTFTSDSGRVVANQSVALTTESATIGGTLSSLGDVTLKATRSLNNTGALSAANNLSIDTGSLDNRGTVIAGQTLTASTVNLANAGEVSGQTVDIAASGTLTNTDSGLIDGADTRLDAGTLNNTGRVYGDVLRARADTINNSGTGVIAARSDLLVGAKKLSNTDGGLIYSLGGITMGGTIDAHGQVQGEMQSLINASAKIEAYANLQLAAAKIINRNDRLTTTTVADAPVPVDEVQPVRSDKRYPRDLCFGIGGGQGNNSCIVHPEVYGRRSTLIEATTRVCGLSGCEQRSNYPWDSPVFAQFEVAPVSSPPPPEPAGGCSVNQTLFGSQQIDAAACNQWRTDKAAWNELFKASLRELDKAIDAYNAEVREENRVVSFADYTLYKLNKTTSRTVVTSTAPGQILSGGSMALSGEVSNHDSEIVAGDALFITGPALNNIATPGQQSVVVNGTTQFTEVRACGTFGGDHCREWRRPVPYEQAPVVSAFDLNTVRVEQYAGNKTAARTLANATSAINTAAANDPAMATGNQRAIADIQPLNKVAYAGPATFSVPNNRLFVVHAEPHATYLVETDPRFTNYRNFISSDYYLRALNLDPSRQLKRYGDGFVEQQQVNDQILAQTGRRYLTGYRSTEAEYKALMDAGVAFAQQYQITPGVALTAEQMALLTTDVVMLVTQTVTLADGSQQPVLVPQVYLRRPAPGDLQANGTLIAASDIRIRSTGDIVNSGTIAGDSVNASANADLINQGGRIQGNDILLRANNDLKNLSGLIAGTGSHANVSLLAGRDLVLQTQTINTVSIDHSSTRTNVQRVATVAGGDVRLMAGRDLVANGASISADNQLLAVADRDLSIRTVTDEYQLNAQDKGGRSVKGRKAYINEASTTQQVSTVESGGDVILAASGNVQMKGAQIHAGTDGSGDLVIQGQNVNIEAAKDRAATDMQAVGRKSYARVARDNETLVSSTLSAAGDLTVRASGAAEEGNGNITLTGSDIGARNGQLALIAQQDVKVQNDTTHHSSIDESYVKSGSLVKTSKTTSSAQMSATEVESGNVSGNTVVIQAGQEVSARGSNVVAEKDLRIAAGKDVGISSAQDSYQFQQSRKKTTSGISAGYSAGVAGISVGKARSSGQASIESSSQHGSVIGSLEGNTHIQAGQQLSVTASDLSAGKDLTLIGQNVDLSAAQDNSVTHNAQQSTSSGFGIGLTVNPLEAFSSAYKESTQNNPATSKVGKALKVTEGVIDGVRAATTPVVIQAHSRSARATEDTATSQARVSTLTAGEDLTILATDGSLTSEGSRISAEGDAVLAARKDIQLDVARTLESQRRESQASGWSLDNRGLLPAGTFDNPGKGQGSTDTLTGTSVSVGGKATLATTTGDITVTGSNVVANGDTVVSAGRNLTLQSGQDSAANDNRSKSQGLGRVVISDTERFAGYHKGKHNDNERSTTQVDANVASLQGSITLTAGDHYTQTASNVLAAKDIQVSGKTVDINTAANTSDSAQNSSDVNIGTFARISSPLIDLSNNVEAASHSDGRLKALQGMAAAANAYQAASALSGNGTLIKGEAGIGVATASSHDRTSGSQAQGSTFQGGRDVTVTATDGNLQVTGSSLSAGQALTLTAGKDLLLDAGQSVAQSSGSNRSAGIEAGVGFTVGAQNGVYGYVAANAGQGEYQNSATIHSNTHLRGDSVSLASQGDTVLKGADVNANTLVAQAKGRLAIESVQDTVTQHSEQSSVGARVQVAVGSAKSGNVTPGVPMQTDGGDHSTTYATVTDGTLTIGGQTTDSAKSFGLHTDAATAHTRIAAAPNMQAAMKEQQAMSAAAGTVVVTSKQVGNDIAANAAKTQQAAQQVLADPNSSDDDKARARQTLLQAKQTQADWSPGGKYSLTLNVATGLAVDGVATGGIGAATANAMGAVLAKQIGDIAQQNQWAEGSPEKTALHGLSGLIQAKIGGTDGLTGLTAGAANEALTPAMEGFLLSQGYKKDTPAFNDLMKLGATMVGAASGAALGGNGQSINAGVNVAVNAETYNRQLHVTEVEWIKNNAKRYAQQKGIGEAEAERQLAQQANRQVQAGAAGAWDTEASLFLSQAKGMLTADSNCPSCGPGYMFYATPEQKANPDMYADQLPKTIEFYGKNGLKPPTPEQIQASVSKDANVRSKIADATLGATAAATAITAPPVLSWCLANPVACNRMAISGGEIVAGDALGPAGLGMVGTGAAVKAVRSADEVNAAMKAKGWQPAWSPGTPVIEGSMQPGTKVRMIVDENGAADIRRAMQSGDFNNVKLGGWATFDEVKSVPVDMRQKAAITSAFKPPSDGPFYVVELEVKKPVDVNVGFAGPQQAGAKNLRGGATQAEFLIPSTEKRIDYLRPVSMPKKLGGS